MADEADMANDKLEKLLDGWMDDIRHQANQPIVSTGECLNCGEPLMDHGRRWCCFDCMQDAQAREKHSRLAGGK